MKKAAEKERLRRCCSAAARPLSLSFGGRLARRGFASWSALPTATAKDQGGGSVWRFPVLSVAPMMDHTDRHFRYMLRQICPTSLLLYTEMVVARSLVEAEEEEGPSSAARHLLSFSRGVENPLILQLGGDDPYLLAKAAELGERHGYDGINLNVGCPSNAVAGSGRFGAVLMRDPARVALCLREMRRAVSPRVALSVKHRIGVDELDSYEHLKSFVERVGGEGRCQWFVVHARKAILDKGFSPKQNRSVPPLRYDVVYRLKRDFPELRIDLNGGVKTLDECRRHLQASPSADDGENERGGGVDGVMIGREAASNPFGLFAEAEAMFSPSGSAVNEATTPTAKLQRTISRAELVHRMVEYAHRVKREEEEREKDEEDEQDCEGSIKQKRKKRKQPFKLWHIARHMQGLFHGAPGAKEWKAALQNICQQETSAVPEALLKPLPFITNSIYSKA
ncbi:tRNA-dihydrouridine(20/20a) synthase [Balamuthia mandrillaris]